MNKNKYEKAKEIFMKYEGSHYEMGFDEEYELYKSYGVPRRIERKWLAELKEKYILRLNSETNEKEYIKKFSDVIEVLIKLKDINSFIDLLINTSQRVKQMTTIPLVIWAEDFIETAILIKDVIKDATFLAKTKEIIIPILEEALSKPLLLSEEFLLLYPSDFTEEKINGRLQEALNTLKEAKPEKKQKIKVGKTSKIRAFWQIFKKCCGKIR